MDKRLKIVAAARHWIGTPYVHQASLKGAGCDCLGLVRGVWRDVEGDEPETAPPYTPDWGERNGRELMRDACRRHFIELAPDAIVQFAGIQPGDVVLFRWRANMPAKHCAIISRPGTIIHAYQNHAVQEDQIPPGWHRRITAAFKFPGVET